MQAPMMTLGDAKQWRNSASHSRNVSRKMSGLKQRLRRRARRVDRCAVRNGNCDSITRGMDKLDIS